MHDSVSGVGMDRDAEQGQAVLRAADMVQQGLDADA